MSGAINQASSAIHSVRTPLDLADLEAFPANPTPGHPNEATRGEEITHFLAERHDAAVNGSAFAAADQVGINAQNQYRAERGQSPVLSQAMTGTTDAAGNPIARFTYADGTHEDIAIAPNASVARIAPSIVAFT